MTPKLERWDAMRIQKAVRSDIKPVVTEMLGVYRPLHFAKAANLRGSYMVGETPHEIIVHIDAQRKDGK